MVTEILLMECLIKLKKKNIIYYINISIEKIIITIINTNEYIKTKLVQ